MTDAEPPWTASVTLRAARPEVLRWIERSLLPEAAREVPRARAELHRVSDGAIELRVFARDSGALRAALNTYLGWIHLSLATVNATDRPG